jgi:hypothetical protein
MSIRIDQLEPELAQKLVSPLKEILNELRYAVPGQYKLRVSLLDANGRKKRSDASAANWSPESGRIEIRFEAMPEESKSATTEVARPRGGQSFPRTQNAGVAGSNVSASSLEIELLRALDRAESTPGWNFVSLKKFRDEILPARPFAPGAFQPADVHWEGAIRNAIEKRLILTGKVPNPKSPQFPVTSIRLNRLMPEVQEILGHQKKNLDFHPIRIKGEPLSAIILRERR